MESENEVPAGSIPPADHIDKREDESFNPEADDGLHLKRDLPKHDGGHEMAPQEFLPRVNGAHSQHPHSEHKMMELELRAAQERIEKLQGDLADAEKKLAGSQKEYFEEISSLQGKLQNSALIGQDKIKALESEAARLSEELNGTTNEVSDLKRHLQIAKQDHGELLGQVDGLKEKVCVLEGQLEESDLKAKKVEESFSAQVEALQREIKNQTEIAKEALDECSRLKSALEVAEASAREAEQKVKNLESEVQKANQVHTLLEETKVEKAKIDEESCLMREKLIQVESHLADEKSRAADLEGKVQNAEVELKKQEDSLKEAEGTTAIVKEKLSTLEEMLKGAQDELKRKEEESSTLQAEVTSLKSKVSESLTTSEGNSKQLKEEHQKQMKASEERYETLQKSSLELEGKTSQLQDSLHVAGTDAETARRKVAELELELDNLLQNKCKSEEGAAELQLQLKSTEEMLSKQVDSLKVAEENAEKANGEVVHLQSVLKDTEEKLRASEEVADTLQLHMTDLTAREAKAVEHLKEVEDGFQKIQIELKSKLEISEDNSKSLEEKAAQLQELLSTVTLEHDEARKKVSDLELELDSLRHIQAKLEEKVRISEEKCSEHQNSAHTYRTRGVELEGLITEHKTKADDAYGKVASLEAALLDTQNKASDLEMKLKLAEDNNVLLENTSAAHIAELERCTKEYEAKIAELEMACAGAKSIEQDTLEKLRSTEKILEERQTEMKSASQKINELELSVEAMESELKGGLEREKLVIEEKALVEEKILKLEALTTKLEGERGEYESRVHHHMSLIEKGKVDLHEASVQEGKLKDEISSLQAAKTELQDLLSQLEIEKQATIAQLDSTQKSFVELNEQLVEERQHLQQQIATIMQLNGDLAQKFATIQEKLHVTLGDAELSAKQVQESSLKESSLNAQIEDLEQENEKLEQTLKNSITTEEHQTRMDQVLATSRLAESKLEEQLSKSKLEINRVQQAFNVQETHVKELESKTMKSVEVLDEQPSGLTKTREIELDLQSPGKVRNRKKKGVTWEADGDAALKKTKAVEKPAQPPAHSLNQFVANILIAVVSLLVGFSLARKIHW